MLKDDIRKNTLQNKGRNIYFSYSSSYVFTSAVEAFRSLEDVEVLQFDEKTEINDIIMLADTVSMFITEKLVVLSGFTKPLQDKDAKSLDEFLSDHDDSVTVVICEDGNMKKKPLSSFSKKCVVWDHTKTAQDIALAEIKAVLAARDISITPWQTQTIFNKCQRQMDLAVLEAKKLSFYLEAGSNVTDADIADCVIDAAERKAYEVADLLSTGRIKESMAALQYFKINAVASSAVLASFAAQYRRLFYTAITDKSDDDLATVFGVKPFAIKAGRSLVGRYKQIQIKRILEKLYYAEYAFKSGVCSDDSALADSVGRIVLESAKK